MNCVKIFRYFDFGTCRAIDLFMTDASYKLLDNVGEFKFELKKFDFLDLKTRKEL